MSVRVRGGAALPVSEVAVSEGGEKGGHIAELVVSWA